MTTEFTRKQYAGLQDAYTFFNQQLFYNALPNCLITLQRKKSMLGYFHAQKFSDNTTKIDEIALNPQAFTRSTKDTLSTLVHEMAHLWQQHFGKPNKGGHNRQWADKMIELGLYPSDTGQVGGKETGQKMSHYILTGHMFDNECDAFILSYELSLYVDSPSATKATKKKNKMVYICKVCEAKAWGKPDLHIQCNDCDMPMLCEGSTEDNEDESEAA